jgi:hypothetical protein
MTSPNSIPGPIHVTIESSSGIFSTTARNLKGFETGVKVAVLAVSILIPTFFAISTVIFNPTIPFVHVGLGWCAGVVASAYFFSDMVNAVRISSS